MFLYVANTHRMQSQSGPKLIISLGIVFTSLTVCLVGTPKAKVHVVHSPNNCVSNFLYTSLYVGPYQGQGYGQYKLGMYPPAGPAYQQQQYQGTVMNNKDLSYLFGAHHNISYKLNYLFSRLWFTRWW